MYKLFFVWILYILCIFFTFPLALCRLTTIDFLSFLFGLSVAGVWVLGRCTFAYFKISFSIPLTLSLSILFQWSVGDCFPFSSHFFRLFAFYLSLIKMDFLFTLKLPFHFGVDSSKCYRNVQKKKNVFRISNSRNKINFFVFICICFVTLYCVFF